MCNSPYCNQPATCTASYNNFPLPPRPPPPDLSGAVQRHTGMCCICPLLDCCHNEMPDDNYSFRHRSSGHHWDSGSPASGYLYPWQPGDESWRSAEPLTAATRGA